ncbi:WD40-repeat-containing domain protein [Mycena galopus ATCC 62051]|nr:WD40-repeat-containing domain protein [Mycena galopus ATCC 62051]
MQSKKQYTLLGKLTGHTGAITCMTANEDGKLLASGGTDGTRIWSLETLSPIPRVAGAGDRGATTCALWVRREDEAAEILFYGTENGWLVCWKQTASRGFEEVNLVRLVNRAEITGLSFDTTTNRLLVCHRDLVVQAWAVERSLQLQNIFSVTIDSFTPKAVAWGDFKNNEREILAFGLYDGNIHVLRPTDGQVTGTKQIGGLIGDVDVHSRKGLYCIDDSHQGVAIYTLDDHRRVKTMEVKKTREHPRPRQVCFSEDGGSVVIGSDHGVVYVFDRWTGETIVELQMGAPDWVQTVAATDTNGQTTILGARCRELDGPNQIYVWRTTKDKKYVSASVFYGVMAGISTALVLVALVILYQNILLYR